MIALDTNILVRALAEEVAPDTATLQQQARAREVLDSAQMYFVPLTVTQELEWVFRSNYKMSREQIARVLTNLLESANLNFENATVVGLAIESYAAGLDFSDALHLAAAQHCVSLLSFDSHFAKHANKQRLKPPVVMP